MADQPLAPETIKRRFPAGLFVAIMIVGLTFLFYALVGISFGVAGYLFLVSLAVVLLVPPILAMAGLSEKRFPTVVAIVQAAVITLITAAILVATGVWHTTSGSLDLQILTTSAALAMGAAALIVSYFEYKFEVTI